KAPWHPTSSCTPPPQTPKVRTGGLPARCATPGSKQPRPPSTCSTARRSRTCSSNRSISAPNAPSSRPRECGLSSRCYSKLRTERVFKCHEEAATSTADGESGETVTSTAKTGTTTTSTNGTVKGTALSLDQ